MKYFVFFAVIISIVKLSKAQCDSWQFYSTQVDLTQNGLEAGNNNGNPTYVGRAKAGGVFIPGKIEGGKFYTVNNGRPFMTSSGFQYLVADKNLNSYKWVEALFHTCIKDAIFVGEFTIGRDTTDDYLIGFVENKNLHFVEGTKNIGSTSSFEVLTCTPKPCMAGAEIEVCDRELNDTKVALNKCTKDVQDLEDDLSNAERERENFRQLLKGSEDRLKQCQDTQESNCSNQIADIQNQLNDALKSAKQLERERNATLTEKEKLKSQVNEKDAIIQSLQAEVEKLQNIADNCNIIQPTEIPNVCGDLRNSQKYQICMNYLESGSATLNKLVNIRDEAIDQIAKTQVTVKPMNETVTTPKTSTSEDYDE